MFHILIIFATFLFAVVQTCDEPQHCQKNKNRCVKERFQSKCPCTCAPHINYKNCCQQQDFKQAVCRDLCTYDLTKASLFKTMYAICFNDVFTMQYCASNGYHNFTDCCLQQGLSKDEPGKAGCSAFCEGNTPACSRLFEYLYCTAGVQLRGAAHCAIETFDKPRWKRNAEIHICA